MTRIESGKLGAAITSPLFRQRALDGYYDNPNICLNCEVKIEVLEGEKVSAVRKKKFCNHSCAAQYTNKNRACFWYDWKAVQVAIDQGASFRECIETFGMNPTTWYNAIETGRIVPNKEQRIIPLEQALIENSSYSRQSLKRRLLREGLLKNECAECGQRPRWKGKLLVLILDHINGVNDDNRLDNLHLLCPNCNSQTETFAGRNVKKRRK